METQSQTTVLDLPTEVLLMILDQLDVKNWIAIAKVHPLIRNVVDIIIRKQFKDLIQYFGQRISKLSVHYELATLQTQHETFNKYLTKYVTPWLKEIALYFSYHTHDPSIGLGPFPVAESVFNIDYC